MLLLPDSALIKPDTVQHPGPLSQMSSAPQQNLVWMALYSNDLLKYTGERDLNHIQNPSCDGVCKMTFLIFPDCVRERGWSECWIRKFTYLLYWHFIFDIGNLRCISQHLFSLLLNHYFKLKKYLSFCQVFQYFISRVRQKLHIVLCMSPVGEAFRSRCRMFPSLVNCCTIDWFVQVGDIPAYLFEKLDLLDFKGVNTLSKSNSWVLVLALKPTRNLFM